MLCTVDLSIEEGLELPLSSDELESVIEFVLASENVTRPCMVSLSIVSDGRIRELNRRYRDRDVPTDVISLECERPDDPDLALDEPCELGDIILAPAYIRNQARRLGTTFTDELRLLLVHGTLHLLGYDHLEEAEAEVMEAREDEILAGLCTERPLGHVALTRHREDGQA